MQQKSAADTIQFRELTGLEFKEIFLNTLLEEFRRELSRVLEATNRFTLGAAFPVVHCQGSISVKILPDEKDPPSFPLVINFYVGTNVENAPDRMRELHDLPVLQPQKLPSGFVQNMPVTKIEGDN